MRYDFDRVIQRRGTDSVKWNRYDEDVIPLWVADLDFASPQPVIDALRRRVEHGVFGYGTEPADLREVVQDRLQRLYGWGVDRESMLFLPGVVVAFNLVAHAVGEAGDGVLIQPPVYPPFFSVAEHTGRVMEMAPLVCGKNGYEIDFDALEHAITPRSRLFLLCNPHNPVGRVFTSAELERLADFCLKHDLILCSDEIHADFVYPGNRHIPIACLGPEIAERTVTLLAPSKSYNIAGFHFCVAVAGSSELRQRLKAAGRGLVPGHPGLLDFVAGLAAYREGDGWLEQLLAYLLGNRDFLVRYVRDHLPGVSMFQPEGTYLAWMDCRSAGIQGPPGEFFLSEARVALSEGTLFGPGGEGFVRLNFGCPRSILKEALEKMRESLAQARAAVGTPSGSTRSTTTPTGSGSSSTP